MEVAATSVRGGNNGGLTFLLHLHRSKQHRAHLLDRGGNNGGRGSSHDFLVLEVSPFSFISVDLVLEGGVSRGIDLERLQHRMIHGKAVASDFIKSIKLLLLLLIGSSNVSPHTSTSSLTFLLHLRRSGFRGRRGSSPEFLEYRPIGIAVSRGIDLERLQHRMIHGKAVASDFIKSIKLLLLLLIGSSTVAPHTSTSRSC
ncbi:hypothetical protein L1987_02192 [Smallanthus sonchifolius]|uniref:Uncharacterized protein n=1 Tax=Smallanthus sonchifolius TaxID=185202 RepID=A0ACB9K7B8_9ASTR|nr:hypothetical protein L1987_02192 [Smallanthus sonchifolius]